MVGSAAQFSKVQNAGAAVHHISEGTAAMIERAWRKSSKPLQAMTLELATTKAGMVRLLRVFGIPSMRSTDSCTSLFSTATPPKTAAIAHPKKREKPTCLLCITLLTGRPRWRSPASVLNFRCIRETLTPARSYFTTTRVSMQISLVIQIPKSTVELRDTGSFHLNHSASRDPTIMTGQR